MNFCGKLDVAATAEVVVAAAERVIASIVSESIRIADDTGRSSVDGAHELLRVETLVEILVLHLQALVLILLKHSARHAALGLNSLSDVRGIEGVRVVNSIDSALDVAAALILVRKRISLTNGKAGDIALQLTVLVVEDGVHVVEDLVGGCDGLSRTTGDRLHEVAVLVLQIVEVEAVLDEVLSGILRLVTATAETEAVAAVDEGEQDDDPPSATAAPIIVVSHNSAYVRRGHAAAKNVLTHSETFFPRNHYLQPVANIRKDPHTILKDTVEKPSQNLAS